jgi:hypothetical protein
MKELKKTDYPRSFYRDRAAEAMRSARKRGTLREWHLGRYGVWRFMDSSFNATIEAAERWHK